MEINPASFLRAQSTNIGYREGTGVLVHFGMIVKLKFDVLIIMLFSRKKKKSPEKKKRR